MANLFPLTPYKLLRVLLKLGFLIERQSGSHIVLRHPNGRVTVVPVHAREDLRVPMIRTILRQIKLTPEEFLKML